MSVIWKQHDFETKRRQKRLSNSQPIDWLQVAGAFAVFSLCAVWARVLYLIGKKAVQFWTQ